MALDARAGDARGRRHRTRRSRRSWPPGPTGRCRTPSRATWRSRPGSWWSSTGARSSTATARTAPARSPPGRSTDEAAEVYELVRRAQQTGLDAVRAGAPCKAVDAVARDVIDDGRARRASSATAWATAWGWRCTRARAVQARGGRAGGRQRGERGARRLPARAGSASGSRTWWP